MVSYVVMIPIHYIMLVFFLLEYFVFFFKQKTAYEMRISDWSSDVCSSDLKASLAVMCGGSEPAVAAARIVMQAYAPRIVHVGKAGAGQTAKMEIGRASCRERVCQYV